MFDPKEPTKVKWQKTPEQKKVVGDWVYSQLRKNRKNLTPEGLEALKNMRSKKSRYGEDVAWNPAHIRKTAEIEKEASGAKMGIGAGVGMRGGLRRNRNPKPCKSKRGMGAGKGKNRPEMEKEAKCAVSKTGKYSMNPIHSTSSKTVKAKKYSK